MLQLALMSPLKIKLNTVQCSAVAECEDIFVCLNLMVDKMDKILQFIVSDCQIILIYCHNIIAFIIVT